MSLFPKSVEKRYLNDLDISTIKKTDKEIDLMIYKLYGLAEEKVNIVEDSI